MVLCSNKVYNLAFIFTIWSFGYGVNYCRQFYFIRQINFWENMLVLRAKFPILILLESLVFRALPETKWPICVVFKFGSAIVH